MQAVWILDNNIWNKPKLMGYIPLISEYLFVICNVNFLLFVFVAIVVFVASVSSLGSEHPYVGLGIAAIVVFFYIMHVTKPKRRA